ncbi:MAG: DinB family protein [Dissulfurispiraceae bacterium]|jgi:hypothetical protein
MAKKIDTVLRDELVALLNGGNAHMGFDDAIAGFPIKAINDKPPHVNYTFWHLLEHMRRAQYDILKFIGDPDYVSPDYSDFWPAPEMEVTTGQWKKTISAIRSNLKSAIKIVTAPETDFFSPIPHAKDYTIFREILLIADHNAYHIAELLTCRQVMNITPQNRW